MSVRARERAFAKFLACKKLGLLALRTGMTIMTIVHVVIVIDPLISNHGDEEVFFGGQYSSSGSDNVHGTLCGDISRRQFLLCCRPA